MSDTKVVKEITREEEKKMLEEWLEKNKPTRLPPDERIAFDSGTITPWFRQGKSKKTKKRLT